MGQPVVCISGREAAGFFYGGERFTRRRAIPRPTLTLLQDFGSVQGLDGQAHRHRKAMFMDLMSSESIGRLCRLAEEEWQAAVPHWQRRGEVALDDEVREVLCRSVCEWAGVPMEPSSVTRRAADLAALFDGAGSVGPRQLRGQLARRRCEAWAERTVREARAGSLRPPEGSALAAIASHRDLEGRALPVEVAAVELLNVLRPTVAVTRYVTFAALALHEHPGWRERLSENRQGDVARFAQEVRRLSPFFPLITGRAARELEWHGHRFQQGNWTMLDIYGTNRDPRVWERPADFDPDRFLNWDGDPFALIPQGGGDHATGHRCPGEWITLALIETALRCLTQTMRYEVPPQDLNVSLARMPALLRSRFRIAAIQPLALTS
ncbi:MAG TPA: cytochrome P450 [Solirubrobacterales bacterium]|nr:cytochrome P450 [Solirubrobacterales bacterium]